LDALDIKREAPRVVIQSPSDRDSDEERRLLWGDYWVARELGAALEELGAVVGGNDPDAVIHLFGSPPPHPPQARYKALWLYSHPDQAAPENLAGFDRIFCASERFAARLTDMAAAPVEVLPACTAKTPAAADRVYDLIFVGNARASREDGRGIIRDALSAGLKVKVWGHRWEKHVPEDYIGGWYWPYERLAELYASARITLNDHHPDMAREGFVSNKVFDILASGGFVISDFNAGLQPLFGDAAPQYRSPRHLAELVDYYLTHEDERESLRRRGAAAAMRHTYRAAAQRLMQACPPTGRGGPRL
jgi:hypothetical protein